MDYSIKKVRLFSLQIATKKASLSERLTFKAPKQSQFPFLTSTTSINRQKQSKSKLRSFLMAVWVCNKNNWCLNLRRLSVQFVRKHSEARTLCVNCRATSNTSSTLSASNPGFNNNKTPVPFANNPSPLTRLNSSRKLSNK